MDKRILVGIDPGETHSGIALVGKNGIQKAENISNYLLIEIISSLVVDGYDVLAIIEDVRPYNMRITDNIINTIKFLGEIEWRLKDMGVKFVLYPRWMIKKWAFDTYPDMSLVEVNKKIEYAAARAKKKYGDKAVDRKRTATFVYVDDRIVEKAMKLWWKIGRPKVGQRTPFGLKSHSWQGLAVATFYILSAEPSFLQIPGTVESSLQPA